MKPIAHRSPAVQRSSVDRDRAVARLRRVTIGATIASITAFGAFGGLAALGNRGTILDGVTTAALTADSNTSTVTDDDSTSVDEGATDTGTTNTPTTTPTPTVTSTSGAAQATSGGS